MEKMTLRERAANGGSMNFSKGELKALARLSHKTLMKKLAVESSVAFEENRVKMEARREAEKHMPQAYFWD